VAPAALLLAVLTSGCGIGASASIEAPVAVYVSLPLTGPRGAEGRDAADGVRLALEQGGGKAGSLRVGARYLDDAHGRTWDPVAVGANARAAVQDSSAAAYIGELDSEPTRASVPITNDAGLLQVSPGAGGVDLTRPAAGYPDSPDRYQPSGTPNFARTVPADDVVVDAAANWVSELGATAALADSNGSAFEDLAAAEFRTAAGEHGIQVGPTPRGPKVAVYQPSAGTIALGGQSYAVSAQLDPGRLPDQEFTGRFRQRFHRDPGPYAAYGYAAMGLVLHAIGDAGTDASSFRDKVRGAVFGAHLDGTVFGSYAITSDGDTTECMIQRYRIVGGRRFALGAPCPPG
jgi:branched-chain amino acid transport system substrate-binding protein